MMNISIFRTRRISDRLHTKIHLVHSEPQGKVSPFCLNLPFTIPDHLIMYGETYFPIDYRRRAITPDFNTMPNPTAWTITNFPLTTTATSPTKDSCHLYKKPIAISAWMTSPSTAPG